MISPAPFPDGDLLGAAPSPALDEGTETAAEAVGPADRSEEPLSCGAYALDLIQRQTRRLGKLQPEVLADADPESLHQLRVSLRRLRTALHQFAPALSLPQAITDARIAGVARRTGLTRDLDVMRERLEDTILPALPESEQNDLRPALRRLAKDRRRAFEGLTEALTEARYLKLLARLHKWQAKPTFTDLGHRPLHRWLFEWQVPIAAGLFLHPGWFAADPAAKDLHDLRKRIKGVRYAFENLQPFLDQALQSWVARLKQAQDDLGELHDLQVLELALADRDRSRPPSGFPALEAEIRRLQNDRWNLWRQQAETMASDAGRQGLHRHLLALT
jgi:CHAD domain-containing protein